MIRKRDNYIRTTDKIPKNKFLLPSYNIEDIYRFYRKSLKIKKGEKSKFNLRYKQVRNILDDYNKILAEELIEGRDIPIPNAIGTIQIFKKWFDEDKIAKVSYVIHRKSNNPLANGRWIKMINFKKHKRRLTNTSYYSFKPVEYIRDSIIQNLKNGKHGMYFEFAPLYKRYKPDTK